MHNPPKSRLALTRLAFAAFAAGLALAASLNAAQAARWVEAHGHACFEVCRFARSMPVVSGRYQNGAPFTVCRADVGGEGFRAGYNLQPNWAHACWVAHGGSEKAIPRYDCLCDR